jgi:hypothetical protein
MTCSITGSGADVVMTPGDIALCVYDAVSSRWRAGLIREV